MYLHDVVSWINNALMPREITLPGSAKTNIRNHLCIKLKALVKLLMTNETGNIFSGSICLASSRKVSHSQETILDGDSPSMNKHQAPPAGPLILPDSGKFRYYAYKSR